MVAMKAISLSHLSISRTSSPNGTRGPQSAKSSLSTTTSVAAPPVLSHPQLKADESLAVLKDSAAEEGAHGDLGERRQSFGAMNTLGAAIRRTTSFRTSTPVSGSGALTPPSDGVLVGRSSSDSASGLVPLSKVAAKTRPHHQQALSTGAAGLRAVPSLAGAQHSHSQPPSSRQHEPPASSGGSAAPAHKFQPTSAGSKPSPAPTSGAHTPLGGGRNGPLALHQLEESYVGKVGSRLGEAVNRVFVPAPAGATAATGDVVYNGRSAPKWIKAREVGGMVVSELHAALPDVYLVRTLLRSSVVKSLSLFLSRLSALLLPLESSIPLSAKEVDTLPLSQRYNFQIVRCAYELKVGLVTACDGAPPFVAETLGPWVGKLDELISRIMSPVITSIRVAVSGICERAIVAETAPTSMVPAGDAPPKTPTTSSSAQFRSLSMGRAAPASAQASGPSWIADLTALFEGTSKLFDRMECGQDAEQWFASVGTHAVWKGMLALSARKVVADAGGATLHPAVTASKGLFKSAKRSPSPPASPPLRPNSADGLHPLPFGSTKEEAPCVRVLCELELFESRLATFSLPLCAASHDHVLLVGACDPAAPCGLCRTGRQFDAESSEDEDDDAGLAECAMREAMQALSAMIVVVRATARPKDIEEALLFAAGASASTASVVTKPAIANGLTPLTPAALLLNSRGAALPSSPLSNCSSLPLVPETSSAPSGTPCPTLLHALDTIPILILLHLLASRLPATLEFQLPHQVWNLEWKAYAKELRGYAAAEEWTPEIGWEMAGEIARCAAEKEGEKACVGEARERLRTLAVAVRTKVRVEVVAV